MSEKRFIDANQFRGKHEVAEVNGKLNSVILYADIVNAQTEDVVEVVRCKDCIFFKESEVTNSSCCDWHREYFETYPNDYCSYGERREQE